MDTSNEDEDLKRAIALSVQEQEPQPSADKEVIDVGSEGGLPNASVTVPSPPVPVSTSHTLLGLDREAMEHERLARKRKASISPPPSRKAMKESDSFTLLSYAQNLHAMYLDGIVKKSWVFGFARKDDISIEEVLQRDHLELAVLSSFQWDIGWVLARLQKTTTTQLYFVMQAKDDATKRRYTKETSKIRNLRLCFPSMAGQVNCMHSKLMLLSYPSHLRVVVPTANLVDHDWRGNGLIENTVSLIDLPRKPDGHHTDTTELTAFGKELVYFLQAMGLENTVVQSVHKFDFSKTKDMAFVHTIGGVHIGDEAWGRTGYCGLGRAVKQLGLDTHKSLNMDFVTSSMGSLNIGFLTTLYLAAQGDDGLTEYTWRYSKKTKAKTSDADKEAQEFKDRVETDVSKDFHIYFPTRDTVASSRGGVRGGGTICFEEKWYESPTFPQQLLRDCKSHRTGVLMHNKVGRFFFTRSLVGALEITSLALLFSMIPKCISIWRRFGSIH